MKSADIDETDPFSDENDDEAQCQMRVGVIVPLIAGYGCFRLINAKDEESALGSAAGLENLESQDERHEILNEWYKQLMSSELQEVFFEGKLPDTSLYNSVEHTSLNVWDREVEVNLRTSLEGRRDAINLESNPGKAEYSSADDVIRALRQSYLATLYGPQSSIESFRESSLIPLYEALKDQLSDENREEGSVYLSLERIVQSMVVPISSLTDKYESMATCFAKSEKDGEPALPTLDELEAEFVQDWWRDVQLSETGNGGKNLKASDKLARRSVLEAQLQMIILLECLRIATTEKSLLPSIPNEHKHPISRKRKALPTGSTTPKMKRRRSVLGVGSVDAETPAESDEATLIRHQYVLALEDLMDEILMSWHVGWMTDDTGEDVYLLDVFVKPVIATTYTKSLPDVVERLVDKAGGGSATMNPTPTSPFFKRTKHGSGRAGSRRKPKDGKGANRPSGQSKRTPDFLMTLAKRQIDLRAANGSKGKEKDRKEKDEASKNTNVTASEPKVCAKPADPRERNENGNPEKGTKPRTGNGIQSSVGLIIRAERRIVPVGAPNVRSSNAGSLTEQHQPLFKKTRTSGGDTRNSSRRESLPEEGSSSKTGSAEPARIPSLRKAATAPRRPGPRNPFVTVGGLTTPTKSSPRVDFVTTGMAPPVWSLSPTRDQPEQPSGPVIVGETPRSRKGAKRDNLNSPVGRASAGDVPEPAWAVALTPTRRKERRGSLAAMSPSVADPDRGKWVVTPSRRGRPNSIQSFFDMDVQGSPVHAVASTPARCKFSSPRRQAPAVSPAGHWPIPSPLFGTPKSGRRQTNFITSKSPATPVSAGRRIFDSPGSGATARRLFAGADWASIAGGAGDVRSNDDYGSVVAETPTKQRNVWHFE
ncbi:hypothetical protein HK104_009466 [Borealophlyctis nickersoniae]|nr:hypothetical protein HK104_009466 [Borealophlyctis nickersoniae]